MGKIIPWMLALLWSCEGEKAGLLDSHTGETDDPLDSTPCCPDSGTTVDDTGLPSHTGDTGDTGTTYIDPCESGGVPLVQATFERSLAVTIQAPSTSVWEDGELTFKADADFDGSGVNDIIIGDASYSDTDDPTDRFHGRVYFFFDPLDNLALGTTLSIDEADIIITGAAYFDAIGDYGLETGDFLSDHVEGQEGDELILNYNGTLLLLYNLKSLKGESLSIADLYDTDAQVILDPDHVKKARPTGYVGGLDPLRDMGDVDGDGVSDLLVDHGGGDCRMFAPDWEGSEDVADLDDYETYDLITDYFDAEECFESIQSFDFTGDGINEMVNAQNSVDGNANMGDIGFIEGDDDLPPVLNWPSRYYPISPDVQTLLFLGGEPSTYAGTRMYIGEDKSIFSLPEYYTGAEGSGAIVVIDTKEISERWPLPAEDESSSDSEDGDNFVNGEAIMLDFESATEEILDLNEFESARVLYTSVKGAYLGGSGIAYWAHPECPGIDLVALGSEKFAQVVVAPVTKRIEAGGESRTISIGDTTDEFYGQDDREVTDGYIVDVDIQDLGEASSGYAGFEDLVISRYDTATETRDLIIIPGRGVWGGDEE